LPDLRGGLDGREVLPHQARPLAPGADVHYPERCPGDEGERERRPEDLAAALALRAVDLEERHGYPFTQTTWRSVWSTSTRSRCACITASIDL
jgi:hypothetical protein